MEVMLTKPYPGARWGVMPGKLDGHVVVHALNPEGVAKDVLQVGDRIVAINGYAVATEVEVVEKLNAAHDKARARERERERERRPLAITSPTRHDSHLNPRR